MGSTNMPSLGEGPYPICDPEQPWIQPCHDPELTIGIDDQVNPPEYSCFHKTWTLWVMIAILVVIVVLLRSIYNDGDLGKTAKKTTDKVSEMTGKVGKMLKNAKDDVVDEVK